MRPLRWLVRRLDRALRRRLEVFEFTRDRACLFRARIVEADRHLALEDGEVEPGAKLLELHFWNEHLPEIPTGGPDVGWGVRGSRMLAHTCRVLCDHLRRDPRFAEIRAVGGVTVLLVPGEGSGTEQLFSRLGFQVFPYRNPLGRFGEFWENVHTWLTMWAFNPGTLRHRRLLQLQRTELWVSREEFLRRHGS